MKKKLTALLCAVFLIGTLGFGQVRDRWINKPFTEILSLKKQLLFEELSSAPSHTSGYGTLYVLSADGDLYYKDDEGNATNLGTIANADAFTLKVDAAATAGYFGVAGGDGIFRFTANHFTMADGGNYVTLSLADHATARAALGLEIGADIPTLAHTMASHSDDDTYNISTSGSATVTKGFFHGAITTATPSGAFTIDWTAKQVHQVTITGANLDITFTNPSAPCRLWLVVIQGDGDDTIDWTHEADILWPGAVDPVLSTGAGDIDVISFIWDGTRYLGVANYDFD